MATRLKGFEPLGLSYKSGIAHTAEFWPFMRGQLQMTTYTLVFLAAWATGYTLGWKIRMIKSVIYAS